MDGFADVDAAAWPPEPDNALTWLAQVRECSTFLRAVPILAELDETALWSLAQHATEQTFAPGETVIAEGELEREAMRRFYVVRSGMADVVRSGAGEDVPLGRLTCGSYFGELGLLTDQARNATVRVGSLAALRVYAFDALSFHKLIAQHVLVFRLIRERNRVRRAGGTGSRLSLNRLGLLQGMDSQQLTWVLGSAIQRPYEDGSEIIVQGDAGDRFHVILEGSVAVERSGDRISMLGPGEFFGETALLFDTPRTATIRCVGPVVTWSITRSAFQQVVGHHLLGSPAAQDRIMKRAQELLLHMPDTPAA